MKHAILKINPHVSIHIHTQPDYNQIYFYVTDNAMSTTPPPTLVVLNTTANTYVGCVPVTPPVFVCPSIDVNNYSVMMDGISIFRIENGGELHSYYRIIQT